MSAATVAVDVPKLRRAVGNASPEWYGAAFQRAFYRTCRGGVATVAMLDRIATTLGMHYSELLQDMEDVMSADLPKDKVYINAERLREFAAEADYKVNFEFGLKNAMTIAQMRGEKPVELWKVESLAVLLKCLPRAIIQVQPAAGTAVSDEEVTMKDSTYAYPCPLCPGDAGSAGGLKTHAGRIHGKTPEVRKAIADRIAEIEKAKQPAEQKPKPDPLRTTPKLDEVHVHEQTAEGVIEAADFNADEPVAERECGECKHPTGECSDCGPKCEEYEEHVDLEERLEGHVQAMSTEEHSETHSRPKSAMLEVEVSVKDLKPVQSLLEFQGSMIHALAERVVELEGKRLFHRTPTVEDVRAWAEMEADRRKRQAFRDRMNVVIDEIEHVLFDVPADEADDAAA